MMRKWLARHDARMDARWQAQRVETHLKTLEEIDRFGPPRDGWIGPERVLVFPAWICDRCGAFVHPAANPDLDVRDLHDRWHANEIPRISAGIRDSGARR